MKKTSFLLGLIVLLSTIFSFGCGNNNGNNYYDKITSITLSSYDTTIYKGETYNFSCSTDAVITEDKVKFVVGDTSILSVGERVNGTYYVYGKAIGTTTIYAYNESNSTVKSNSLTFKVTSDKDIYLTKEILNLSNGQNGSKENSLTNNRRTQYSYKVSSKGLLGNNNSFKFTSLDLDVSNVTVADLHHGMGIYGDEVITEIAITLKNPVSTSGDYIEMYIGEMGFDDTVKFNFQAGSNTAKTTSYFKGAFIVFYALDGGLDLEIESISIDIKWYENNQHRD